MPLDGKPGSGPLNRRRSGTIWQEVIIISYLSGSVVRIRIHDVIITITTKDP